MLSIYFSIILYYEKKQCNGTFGTLYNNIIMLQNRHKSVKTRFNYGEQFISNDNA